MLCRQRQKRFVFFAGKDPFGHPAEPEDKQADQRQQFNDLCRACAQKTRLPCRDCQQVEPHQREQDAQQGDDKAPDPHAARLMNAQGMRNLHRPDTAAEQQEQACNTREENGRQVVFQRIQRAVRILFSTFLPESGKRILHLDQRGAPIDGVQRRRRGAEQPFGLTFANDLVDLAHQPVRAQKLALCDLHGGQQGVQLLVDVGAGLGHLWRFGFGIFALGRCAQGGKLVAQRSDTFSVQRARGLELGPVVDDTPAQAVEFGSRCVGLFNRLFRLDRNTIPLLRRFFDVGLRESRGRQAKRQKTAGQKPPERRDHWSSKTPGMDCGARSSQAGTGRSFSRRKSGLNSFD